MAVIGLVRNRAPADGGEGQMRLMPMAARSHFLPETLVGGVLPLIDRVECYVHNAQVQTLETRGAALARYMGITNRTTSEKFGFDETSNDANYFMPMYDRDFAVNEDEDERTGAQKHFVAELTAARSQRYIVSSPICGFPFGYDTKICELNDNEDLLENRYFPPNVHLDVRIVLKTSFREALRALDERDDMDNDARANLWLSEPTVVIDSINLLVDQVAFPQNHEFVKALEKKREQGYALIFPMSSSNEIRENIHQGQSQQRITFNLHQMGYPRIIYCAFFKSHSLDGTGNHTLNHSVFKFIPHLESMNISCGGISLLASGGPVTRLSVPNIDTVEKFTFHQHQNKHRREPESISDFYSPQAMQQYVFIDLEHLYGTRPADQWKYIENIDVDLAFSDDLSPAGYQIVCIASNEKQFVLKSDNSHMIIGSSGLKFEGK